MNCVKSQEPIRRKIGLIEHPGFDDGKRLLEQLVQTVLFVLAFGYESVKERLAGRITFLGREAAPEELAADQAAAHLGDAHLAADAGAGRMFAWR